jgi:hypothetical protein
MGHDLSITIPALGHNYSFILQILPDLANLEHTGYIMRFRASSLWLATLIGVVTSQGVFTTTDLSSCAMKCNISTVNLGAAVQKQSV